MIDDYGNDLCWYKWDWEMSRSWFVSTATYGGFCDDYDNVDI